MTTSDKLMILVVLFSPFLAVFAQRMLDEFKERRGQKLWIFRTLMATRGNKISPDHVQALNMIDLFFERKGKEKAIVEKWDEYLDHLAKRIDENDQNYKVKIEAWTDQIDENLAEMLHLMGKSLGYDFDKVRIKKGIYVPRGHGDIEFDNTVIRKGMVSIMMGKAGFPVAPFGKFKDDSEKN